MPTTELKQAKSETLLHALRHITGRTSHELIEIGDEAADEIVRLRLLGSTHPALRQTA